MQKEAHTGLRGAKREEKTQFIRKKAECNSPPILKMSLRIYFQQAFIIVNKAQIKKNQILNIKLCQKSFKLFLNQTLNLLMASHVSLKPLQLPESVRQDTEKLVKMEKSLNELTTELVNRDIDTIQSETSKIQGFANGINSVLSKLKIFKQQCGKTIAELDQEVNDLNGKIKVYERDFKNNNKQNEYKKQIQANQKKYLAGWERRIQISSKINTDPFLKVQIQDRKSKANQIFKWIIVTIYGEPDTKFYWPNFKDQVFQRDQGNDFRQRLGKINASSAREQQKVKTQEFLKSYKDIASCQQLKKVSKQIDQIKSVAEIFLDCYQISKAIKNFEELIQKSRQESRERDQEAMRWKARVEALQDRIKANKEYQSVLNKIQSLLDGKVQSYIAKQATAKEIVQRLKDNNGELGSILIDTPDEKMDNCECNIF